MYLLKFGGFWLFNVTIKKTSKKINVHNPESDINKINKKQEISVIRNAAISKACKVKLH